ncbi:MAG: LTA synthase family protein [Bacteroidales bacterium]
MNRIPDWVKPFSPLLKAYLWGIAYFTLFRLIILIFFYQPAGNHGPLGWLLGGALGYGWRFDTVISGYLLSFPLLLTSFCYVFKIIPRWITYTIKYWITFNYLIAFAICAADIPYFAHYFSRLDIAVFQWIDSPKLMLGMVLGEMRYAIFLVLFLLLGTTWILVINRIFRQHKSANGYQTKSKSLSIYARIIIVVVLGGVCFLAIRGRIEKKSPIRTGTAYFSGHPFYDQAGLNPVFTFIQSWLDVQKTREEQLQWMPTDKALKRARHLLSIQDSIYPSPLARKIPGRADSSYLNIVVVLMEGMSMGNTGLIPQGKNLTPVIDSMARLSVTFTQFHSAGIHTFNGIFSSLYGFPALKRQHPMNKYPIPDYTGLPVTLKGKGYHTLAFIPHDDQFDNIGGFFKANGFEKIFSERDFKARAVSTLGIPDHALFRETIRLLNQEIATNHSPFLAFVLTASNHGPYVLPKDFHFKPVSRNLPDQMVEYADRSLGQFLREASAYPWFNHTLFVITADHGATINPQYELPLSLNHIPLLLFTPGGQLRPTIIYTPGSQTDLFATLMEILGFSYINNTAGTDLLHQPMGFTFFGADDKLGILTDSLFLILKDDQLLALYNLTDESPQNQLSASQALADSLKMNAWSLMQSSQYVLNKGLTGAKGLLPIFEKPKPKR